MNRHLVALAAAALTLPATMAAAQTSSSFFTNDYIGDGHDRWRSGGYTKYLSFEPTREWNLSVDVRMRSEILSPWGSTEQPTDSDRPYVGMLGFGVFANDDAGIVDYNFGGELLLTGPQTGVARFQEAFHETFDLNGYEHQNDHDVYGDDLTGLVMVGMATKHMIGDVGAIRPFVIGQVGYESFLRAGFDVMIGNYAHADRYVRDPISGFVQPSSAQRAGAMQGVSLLAGFDYTHMSRDYLMSDIGTVEPMQGRTRTRLGLQAGLGPASIFYGATRLSEEFEGQVEGQTVGTISVEFTF